MDEAKQNNDSEACPQCRTGMNLVQVKKYSGKMPLWLIVLGVLCCLFIVGAIVGIPLILAGSYMATARETVKCCPSCSYYFKVLVPKPY